MLARRLLIAGSGGAITAPPAGPPSPFALTTSPIGGWSWFGRPRAVRYGANTYVSEVNSSNGDTGLVVVPHSTQTAGSPIVLKAALDIDDHIHPAFLVRASDHKLMAFYSRHEPLSTTAHMRISTNSLDTDPLITGGFDAEVSLDAQLGGSSYDYCSPYQLSNGDIHLYYRDIPGGNSYRMARSISTDDGATWGAQTTLYINTENTGRAYWQITQLGDRIDFAITNGSPNTDATSLSHLYWTAGAFYKTDGTVIAALPFAFADATVIYVGSTDRGWVSDMAYDASNNPVIIYPVFVGTGGGVPSDIRYKHSRWTGSAWTYNEITTAGASIDARIYPGEQCFVRGNPNTVYASRNVGGMSGMWEYKTTDGGATWAGQVIIEDPTIKYIRPFVPDDAAPELPLLFLYGTYTDYDTWSMGIMAAA